VPPVRIFLTGATGYIGRALCRQLAADGHELHALVRPATRVEPLVAAGVTFYPGDIRERVSMREGMSGADWVVHAAADLDLAGPAGRMEAVNVGGSENVAALAFKLGVGRFLSISSVAYFGGSPEDGSAAVEESPPLLPFPTRYCATKHAGERAIRVWAARGLPVHTIYPSLVYGAPSKREGANALLRQLALGRFPALVGADRIASWVHLDDVVDAVVRVMAHAAPGSAHLLAGEALSVRELAARVALASGVPAPRREVSVATARWALRLARPLFRLVGRRPPIAATQLDSLARHWNFDDGRARRELGWRPRPLDEGLPMTLRQLFELPAP
jgi:dihydroflavonol-4-reductase